MPDTKTTATSLLLALSLTACAPTVPHSAPLVGFYLGTYSIISSRNVHMRYNKVSLVRDSDGITVIFTNRNGASNAYYLTHCIKGSMSPISAFAYSSVSPLVCGFVEAATGYASTQSESIAFQYAEKPEKSHDDSLERFIVSNDGSLNVPAGDYLLFLTEGMKSRFLLKKLN